MSKIRRLCGVCAMSFVGLASCDADFASDAKAPVHETAPAAALKDVAALRLDATERELLEAAEASAQKFLRKIPEGDERLYGFKSRTEFRRVRLERPFRMYAIQIEGGEIRLDSFGEWRVPLSVDGDYRALLTMAPSERGFRGVDFGAAGLAAQLGALSKQQRVDSAPRVLIRSHLYECDFAAFGCVDVVDGGCPLLPLPSAREHLLAGTPFEHETAISVEQLRLAAAAHAPEVRP